MPSTFTPDPDITPPNPGRAPPPRHQILLKKKFNLNFVPERTVPDGIKDRVNNGVEYANPI